MFKKSRSPQKTGRIATIPEAESLKDSEEHARQAEAGLAGAAAPLMQKGDRSDDLFAIDDKKFTSDDAVQSAKQATLKNAQGADVSWSSSDDPTPMRTVNSSIVQERSGTTGADGNATTTEISTLKMMRLWNLKMGPYKKTMMGGHLMPTPLSPVQFMRHKKRRVTIEVHGVSDGTTTSTSIDADNTDQWPLEDSDVIYLRMYQKVKATSPTTSNTKGSKKASGNISSDEDDEYSCAGFDDETSVAMSTSGGGMSSVSGFFSGLLHHNEANKIIGDEEWQEHRSFKLEDVEILRRSHVSSRTIEVKMGFGNNTVTRDFKFATAEDSMSFETILGKLKDREKDRASRKVARYRQAKMDEKLQQLQSGGTNKSIPAVGDPSEVSESSVGKRSVVGSLLGELSFARALDESVTGTATSVNPSDILDVHDTICLLVEIVSATDLPVADFTSTDAFVTVRMGGKEIHRTNVCPKTLNPVWTLTSGSLFITTMTPEEYFACSTGMSFAIKDYDALGGNETLGSVTLSLEHLLKCKGEREGYIISPSHEFKEKTAAASLEESSLSFSPAKKGTLYLRVKPASPEDVAFMDLYKQGSKKDGVYSSESLLPIRPPPMKLLKRGTKHEKGGGKLIRVKPFPDPDRPEETKWMTKEQIMEESMKPSTHWVEAGSGTNGRLFLEILGCKDLPNCDALTMNPMDSTDAFANIVFEDAIVNSDIIDNTLSPRWMPWCRRAFVFNVAHPSSTLLLGLFDFDPEFSPLQRVAQAAQMDVHDAIGRIKIRLSNFPQGTTCTLAYPLFYGEEAEQRQTQRGTVWLRIRTEWFIPRQTLLTAAFPPQETLVSVARQIDFQVAYYTVEGPHDESAFDMGTFAKYIEELYSYEILVDYAKLAAYNVWLWRGHFPVTIGDNTYFLPLHSIIAFAWGITVTWDFNKIPSFFMFAIGWAFLATNEFARSCPYPWVQPPPFIGMLFFLAFNKVPDVLVEGQKSKMVIKPNQHLAGYEAWKKEKGDQERRWKTEKELQLQHQAELMKEYGEVEEVDISSSKGGGMKDLNVNPLKGVLYPIQLQLHQLVVYLRIASSVVQWDETYFAFWITLASFAASLVLYWIPFAFLIRWISRIGAFVILGPWMALADHWYFRNNTNLTTAEKDEIVRQRVRERMKSVKAAAALNAANQQIRKERTIKLKSLTKYMFGNFTLRVPRFCEDSFRDTPLPESFAEPFDKDNAPPIKICERVYGQVLSGDMIPKREVQVEAIMKKREFQKRRRRRGIPKDVINAAEDVTGKVVGNVVDGINKVADAVGDVTTKVADDTVKTVGSSNKALERVPLLGKFGKRNKKGYASVTTGDDKVE